MHSQTGLQLIERPKETNLSLFGSAFPIQAALAMTEYLSVHKYSNS